MPNSRAIDKALCDYLAADATLMAILPDGVYMNEGTQRASRFVVVTLAAEKDEGVFGGRGWENALYLVKVVAKSGVLASLYDAEARLDALLDGGTFTVSGYTFMACFREERVRMDERDEFNHEILWFHGGGYYRVQVAVPIPA